MASNRIRIKRSKNFTNISNEMLSDIRLSYRARGLLAYILTKPDNRSFNNTDLCNKSSKEGRDAIDKAKLELKQLNYLVISRSNDSKGKIVRDRIISDTPYTENQEMVNQGMVNHTLKTTPYSNTNSKTRIESSKEDTNEVCDLDNVNEVLKDESPADVSPPIPNDPPIEKKEYGSKDVNAVIKAIKDKLTDLERLKGIVMVYDNSDERTFAWHILTSKKFVDLAKSINRTAIEFAVDIIDVACGIDYYKPIRGPKLIYKYYGEIYTLRQIQKNKDPIRSVIETIKDDKLKSKVIKEIESRKSKNLEIDPATIQRVIKRLSDEMKIPCLTTG